MSSETVATRLASSRRSGWRRIPGVVRAGVGLALLSLLWGPMRSGGITPLALLDTGAVCVLSVVALALLLRHPVADFLVVALLSVAGGTAWAWSGSWWGGIDMVVLAAGYHLGRRTRPRSALALGLLLAAVQVVANVASGLHQWHVQEAEAQANLGSDAQMLRSFLPTYLYSAVQYMVMPVAVGMVVRRQGARLERAETLLAQRDAEIAQLVERAVHDDRERMAHELHDLAAHHSTAVLVNAKAAKAVREARPDLVPGIIDDIVDQSQQAQSSLRQMVQLLHDADEPTSLAPQPTLAEIPDLVESARRLNPDIEEDLRPAEVSPSVALTAYRLVQESLTNAHRHAPGAPVTVFVGPVDGVLQVEVTNGRSRQAPLPVTGSGTGVEGMAARVHALGGWFEAGALDRGWQVLAEIPMEAR